MFDTFAEMANLAFRLFVFLLITISMCLLNLGVKIVSSLASTFYNKNSVPDAARGDAPFFFEKLRGLKTGKTRKNIAVYNPNISFRPFHSKLYSRTCIASTINIFLFLFSNY